MNQAAYMRAWRKKNAKQVSAYNSSIQEKARQAEKSARHRSQNKPALTPIEQEWLLEYYAEARRLTLATGTPHHVDHVTASCHNGEHAPWNMQILTRYDNQKKRSDKQEYCYSL